MKKIFLSAFAAIALIGTAATGVIIADGGADSDHQRGHQGQGMMGHGTSMGMGMGMGMGKTLMTEEERKGFRKSMHDAETQEERQEVRKSMRETMKQRAKEKGI